MTDPGADGRRSVAFLADNLAAWIRIGIQPTGIQRVVSELLVTASAQSDIRAWPAVTVANWRDVRVREIPRQDLLWSSRSARGPEPAPGRGKRIAKRVVPRPVRTEMRRIEAWARAAGRPLPPVPPPDQLVVADGFWDPVTVGRLKHLARKGTAIRLLIYDLFPITHPEWFDQWTSQDFTAGVDALLPLADRVVTFGSVAATDIAARYPSIRNAMRVAIPALHAHAPRTDPAASMRVPGPFILALGTVEPRKNHRLILDAWRLARERGMAPDAWLAVVGRRGWLADDIEREITAEAERLQIVRYDHATDGEVEALYAACRATVHASWAEGFGLGVRESVVRGIPTLMSLGIPRDGLPDGTYQLFEPDDPAALAALMVDAIVAGHVRAPIALGEGTGWEPVLSALVD